jgi:hypothetical protein
MKELISHNFSYPSSAAAVVFGGHLSARAAFRLDRKATRNPQLNIVPSVGASVKRTQPTICYIKTEKKKNNEKCQRTKQHICKTRHTS